MNKSSVLIFAVMVVGCGQFEPVSRRQGETCESHTDCEGALFCNSQKVCASNSSGGGGGGGMTSSSNCSPACPSSDICINNASGGPTCLPRCTSDSQCSYCCASLVGGGGACAQNSGQCSSGSGACPSGTYRQTSGGSCVSEPSSCPNGWTVCTCPGTHGTWCHPNCGQAGNPGRCDGSSC